MRLAFQSGESGLNITRRIKRTTAIVLRAAREFVKSIWWHVAAIASAWLWLYQDVIRRLIDDWRVDENYSHGFLIPFISAYAIWAQRRGGRLIERKPRWLLGGGLI